LVESVTVPKDLLRELRDGLAKVEEVLATLEELSDRDGLERIRLAEEDYKKGQYTVVKDSKGLEEKLEQSSEY
jgi:hypothetical protein